MQDLPATRDLVLIGGGHSHALVLRRWGMHRLPGARLTVINAGPTAAYSGMLPGFVAGHYRRDELDIDLHRLAAFAGARLVEGVVTRLDPGARLVEVAGRPPIGFDVASVNVGVTSAMPDLPGFAAHGVPAKPLGPLARAWQAFLGREEGGEARVAVIGGGVAGIELAMAMAHRLQDLGHATEVSVVDRGRALAEATPRGARILRARLAALGIALIEGVEVAEVTAGGLRLGDGRTLASDFTVGAAGAVAWPWLAETGLATERGFLVVDRFLRTSDAAIFAAGDCAHMAASPRPKAGVFAVRQAPVLAGNLRAALSGGRLAPYRPQRDYLKLVSLGRQDAVAEKWGRALAGPPFWRWKDRIDRRFMARLNPPPAMPVPPLPPVRAEGLEALAAPMCAGCGAKVGRGTLSAVLGGVGDDAALLQVGGARLAISADHLRSLTADPVVMARIAAVHALGDVWAMGARPHAALASIVLPRMAPPLQQRTLAEIMAAARAAMAEAGAEIVGGHSSLGAEMTIGFTVTGLLEVEPIGLAGARAGDVLVLTKPLGSGTILAAAMAGRAPAPILSACLAQMQVPQGRAAEALRGARAMTDVTGFGLAGHLGGICAASGVAAELDLSALPLMDGAEALAAAGVRSTLWAENRAGAGPVDGATGARGVLLFDPQTAGGLLAALPEAAVGATLAALHACGSPAARIGRIVAGAPAISCRP